MSWYLFHVFSPPLSISAESYQPLSRPACDIPDGQRRGFVLTAKRVEIPYITVYHLFPPTSTLCIHSDHGLKKMSSTAASSVCERLLLAVKDKDQPRVEQLLKDSDLATLTSDETMLILHESCYVGERHVIKCLLDHKFDPTTPDCNNHTALHILGSKADFGSAQLLLQYVREEKWKFISMENNVGETILHFACQYLAEVDFVKYILEQMPDEESRRAFVNLREKSGHETVLHMLSFHVNPITHEKTGLLAQCLVDANVDRNALYRGRTALSYACEVSNHHLMQVLLTPDDSHMLQERIFEGQRNKTCLHVAVENGNVDCVEWLLSNSNTEKTLDGSKCTPWEALISQKSFDLRMAKPFISRELQGHHWDTWCHWHISEHPGGWNVVFMSQLNNVSLYLTDHKYITGNADM